MGIELADLVAGNAAYVQARCGVPPLPPVPAEGLIILTCMDVRIDPLTCLGLAPGSAHILRNAGARITEDVVRSIMVSTKLMGTDHVVIMGHTRCGLSLVSNYQMGELVAHSQLPAQLVNGTFEPVERNQGAYTGRGYDFLAFADIDQAVASDVFKLAWHPLMPPHLRVTGLVLDVESGRVRAVPGATRSPGSLAESLARPVDII